MTNSNKPLVSLGECTHVGVQVGDVKRVIEVFTKLFGWGPWENPREKVERKAIGADGKPFTYNTTGAFVRLGSVVLDITETHGEDFRTQFVSRTGGGLHHLNFDVDDVEEEISKLEKIGLPLLEAAMDEDGKYKFAYFDIEGIIIELRRRR